MREYTVVLPSGRVLQVAEGGDPYGDPIFFLHGTPGCRLLYGPSSDYAAPKGIRLIGYDRPGYGGSTALWGRTVAVAARDVQAIADHLGFQRYAVYGWGGGGAGALACAALRPGQVVAAASLAAIAPYPAEGLERRAGSGAADQGEESDWTVGARAHYPGEGMEWTAGAGEMNVQDFQLMLHHRWRWGRKNRRETAQLRAATADQLRDILTTLLSEVDRRAFTGQVAQFLHRQVQEGLKQGEAGMRDDNLSMIRPWGFHLGSIRVPVQIWHGGQDRFVPFSHGQWIAARVPRADVHLIPNDGHITLLVARAPAVIDWLASKF